MAIGDASDQGTQFNTIRASGSEGKRAPSFEHFLFSRAREEMIHHPEAKEACTLGTFGQQSKGIAEMSLAVGPGEIGDLETKLHDERFLSFSVT
jgi:hypothetical protein